MLWRLYYSVRNLLYYRELRYIPAEHIIARVTASMPDLQAMGDALTDTLLLGAGLRIAHPGEAQIPLGIYLTRKQRDVIRQVGAAGYRAALR